MAVRISSYSHGRKMYLLWGILLRHSTGVHRIIISTVIFFFFYNDYLFRLCTVRRLEDMDSVDAFFHAMAQTVKQLKPITVAKIKRAVSIIVSNAEIEEMETAVSCPRFSSTEPKKIL